MPFWWLIQLVVAVALAVISYALAPKPKKQKPPATRDLDDPTAEAGRPIPVVFGTINVKSGNILYFTDKGKREYEVRV